MRRKPAVAGQFYSSDPSVLAHEVTGYCEEAHARKRAKAIVSPHAGLMYSGAVAGAVFSRIEPPESFVILSPNHTGLGRPVSLMTRGSWEVPTGHLEIDVDLADRLRKGCSLVDDDSLAHEMEHSIEVQLPFVIHLSPSSKIVPVTMMTDSIDTCRIVGEALAEVVSNTGYSVTIVASSDMTHFEADSVARLRDRKAIEMVLSLDPEGLYRTVRQEGISMCGYIPVTTMLFAVLRLGASEAELVKYMTSGDVSGDYDRVVGYAGIIIT
jgi:AmmeMemoRadiSam system protein B